MTSELMYLTTTCPFCGATFTVTVHASDYEDWQNGKMVQDAFPYLSAEARELLVSGICPDCWDGMFGDSDDEDEYEEEEDAPPVLSYEERIMAIAAACDENGIPYTVNDLYEGWQIRFPWCEGDVACHDGTYGAKNNKVESYCFPWDDGDVSVLDVDEAIEHISTYYSEVVQNGLE
jgi:hypothetical protein